MADRQLLLLQCGDMHCTAFADAVHSIRRAPVPESFADLSLPLAPLLGVEATATRKCSLLVTIRRHTTAILVDTVDQVPAPYVYYVLPPLIAETGHAPWATGIVALDSLLCLHIDLRAIALYARSAHAR